RINFDPDLVTRALNVDLSGGEKKRNETLQLGVLEPRIAILDELDSGLDIDALRDCARRVEAATHESNLGVLAITHYVRLLEELKPDVVHILSAGRIVKTGGPELADTLERDGYAAFV
ncbi:MAG: Fe-S cluster assembly ATPase SufC, partial [Actinomycetota bacterium]